MTTRRRNIAVVSDAVMPFNKGGKEARIANLTAGLAARGNDVHIYTMKWWDGPRTLVLDGISYHAISPLYPLYHGNRRSIKQGIFFGVACLSLLRYDFDVLEVDHMPFFPLYAAKIVSLVKRRPLIATWHEVWGKAYWREYLGAAGIIAYAIEKLSVSLPNHIIAVSEQTKDQLRSVLGYKGTLDVVNNGIDYAAIVAVKPARRTTDVIYTGRLLAHKNVNLLIDAIGMLARTNPKISCLIIGDGPEYDRLTAQIKDLGLSRNVRLAGRVDSNDDVFAAMKSSKVFVSPSVREGFGITVLEAFACGLPVITVDHPSNAARRLVNRTNGIVCAPTAEAIAASLTKLLRTPRPELSARAERYDWHHSASAVNRVYSR